MTTVLQTLGLALCMFVLVIPSVVATGDEEDCSRWNCPCAGQTRLKMMVMKRQNPQPVILQSARQTREKTRQLLDRIVSERFRNNHEHVESLESCVQNRDQRCLGLHLDRRCRLEGFPHLHQIQNAARFDESSLQAFMRDAQQLLSSLAVYVQQARQDELDRVTDPIRSLADDIQRIEENGIYQILCSLQIAANYRDIPWDATVARGVMLLGCRAFDTQAPIDNRNYMIFYTLEKLLNQIGKQAMRKRSDPWEAPALPPSSPGYLQIADGSDDNDDDNGHDDNKDDMIAQKLLQMSKINFDESNNNNN